MDDLVKKLFSPVKLGGLELKNRIIRTACFEGMSPNGVPSEELIAHHRESAAGGVAMTTVAYCSVSLTGRTYDTQIYMRDEILPELKKLTEAVHKEGAKASIQLGHCGYFASKKVIGTQVLGASKKFNLYGLSFCKEMREEEIAEVLDDFVRSARLSVKAGFDAIELHFGHGYLISQFLSPYTNSRKDRWGGSLENRMRLGCKVLSAVKGAVNVPVILKMNLHDGFTGGLTLCESIKAVQKFELLGADAVVLSGGFVSKSSLYMMRGGVPTLDMVRGQKGWARKVGLLLFGKIFLSH